MLTAVEFDHELCGVTSKVCEVRADGCLTAKVRAVDNKVAQMLPEDALCVGEPTVEREAGRFVLTGSGWGHGVGLCQIGAAVMANEGRAYREILSHYYPGTAVGRALG